MSEERRVVQGEYDLVAQRFLGNANARIIERRHSVKLETEPINVQRWGLIRTGYKYVQEQSIETTIYPSRCANAFRTTTGQ